MSARKKRLAPPEAEIEASLLDLVDHVLNKGVVLNGDVMLGVANIDLVYLRLSAVLCAADKILGRPARAGIPRGRRR
jgi:hypothetical protein